MRIPLSLAMKFLEKEVSFKKRNTNKKNIQHTFLSVPVQSESSSKSFSLISRI
jgi:hypothetical protein